MEKKKSNKISWSTIYSLGLVPAILVWGLAPSLKENVIVLTSIIAGIIWTISYLKEEDPIICAKPNSIMEKRAREAGFRFEYLEE